MPLRARAEGVRRLEGDHCGDLGSASIWVLAGCLLLGTVAVVPVGIGEVALARHRAAVAADLAALAGSQVVSADADSACRLAGRIAAANGAQVLRCLALPCARNSAGPGAGRLRALPEVSLQVETGIGIPDWLVVADANGARALARAGPPGCVSREPTRSTP